MTILILTHSYPDKEQRFRGIFVKEQARSLSELHKIIVVYFKTNYSKFAPFSRYSFNKNEENNIIEYEVVTNRSFPVINQVKYFKDTYSFLNKEIFRKTKVDIIHSHLSYPAGFLGTLIYKFKGIPNVLTEHTSIRKYFRSIIHKYCVKYTLKESPEIICVSNSLKNEVQEICHREITVIHNLVDTAKFSLANHAVPDLVNIGFLGSLNNSNKGLDLLLKAVKLIDHNNVLVHIGGSGSKQKEFENLSEDLGLKEICRFYGEIKTETKNEFYSRLNFFVLPSRYETFGIVLIEAMACGLPVISTKCGGPQDIVSAETGILVEKDNVTDLADALSQMRTSFLSYNSQKIRSYTELHFGKKTFNRQLTDLYNKMLKHEQED
jgi:glycosyltransferase involved in cell wall biosynthesis